MIDRKQLKFTARGFLAGARPSPWMVVLAAAAVLQILSLLQSSVTNAAKIQSLLLEYYNNPENYEELLSRIMAAQPGVGAWCIDLLLQIMALMVSTGVIIFVIRTVRDGKGSFGNLLDGLPVLLRVIGYEIVTYVFVFLWSLLFVIPGFIAAYRYRQGPYLLLDHPEMGIMDCISASKHMMKGHKGELFVMDLSFFGWFFMQSVLLNCLAMFLPALAATLLVLPLSAFVRAYTEFTYFLYYEALQGIHYDSRIPSADKNDPVGGDF